MIASKEIACILVIPMLVYQWSKYLCIGVDDDDDDIDWLCMYIDDGANMYIPAYLWWKYLCIDD